MPQNIEERIKNIAHSLGKGKERKNGNNWITCCPVPAHNDQNPSFSLGVGDNGELLYHCFKGCTGKEIIESLISLGLAEDWTQKKDKKGVHQIIFDEIGSQQPCSKVDAKVGCENRTIFNEQSLDEHYLEKVVEKVAPPKKDYFLTTLEQKEQKVDTKQRATDIWNETIPIKSTLGEEYLSNRDLTAELLKKREGLEEIIRFDAIQKSLTAKIQDVKGNIQGIQRTFLKEGGKKLEGIPKKTLGSLKENMVYLPSKGRQLILTEGVEDALTLAICLPQYNVGAFLGGNLDLKVPLHIREVIIAGDNDEVGQKFAKKLKKKLQRQGKAVAIVYPPSHKDFNEWWQGYRYTYPIQAWAAGVTNAETRQVLERTYMGTAGSEGAVALHLILSEDKQQHLYHIQHSSGGISQIRFKSYEQGRKAFQGAEIDVVHLDEEPPREIYIESLMRTMETKSGKHGMVLLTMTPLMGLTDMVMQFYQDKEEGKVEDKKFYIQASWEDNPHLKEDEKLTILKSLRPHEKEAREKGIPSLGMGLVYPVAENNIICDPFNFPEFWPKVYGIDFGWNPSPTAVLFAAHDRDNDIVYLYDEYSDTEKTPQEHVYQLRQKGYNLNKMVGVYDPAGRISSQKDGENLVTLYRNAGARFLNKADNSKEKGLMAVLERMQNGRLKIFKTCTKTLKELRMYARDENGIPKKGNDHFMDAMRYIIITGLGYAVSRVRINEPALPPRYLGPHGWMAQ